MSQVVHMIIPCSTKLRSNHRRDAVDPVMEDVIPQDEELFDLYACYKPAGTHSDPASRTRAGKHFTKSRSFSRAPGSSKRELSVS